MIDFQGRSSENLHEALLTSIALSTSFRIFYRKLDFGKIAKTVSKGLSGTDRVSFSPGQGKCDPASRSANLARNKGKAWQGKVNNLGVERPEL